MRLGRRFVIAPALQVPGSAAAVRSIGDGRVRRMPGILDQRFARDAIDGDDTPVAPRRHLWSLLKHVGS